MVNELLAAGSYSKAIQVLKPLVKQGTVKPLFLELLESDLLFDSDNMLSDDTLQYICMEEDYEKYFISTTIQDDNASSILAHKLQVIAYRNPILTKSLTQLIAQFTTGCNTWGDCGET